jgi:broad specificity phosphatase PhoE
VIPGPEVILVRHGATEWSESGRHTSVTDLPLTPSGEAAARALGPWLARRLGAGAAGPAGPVVLSSPRRRALDTCRLAGLAGRCRVVPELAEWDYGDYEGLTTAEIRERDPGWAIFDRGAPGGESVTEVQRRADVVVALLRAAPADGGSAPAGPVPAGPVPAGPVPAGPVPARPVIAFGHGHFLRVVAARWVGLDAGWGRALAFDAAAVGALGWERETPVIRLWNLRP